ncbi:MAG: pirin family protein [Alphaproteobacteria bacterium]|nr:pirin family protein [Alphaproteobacteria bacterium]
MLTIRKAQDRGQTKLDWLDGRHSFSFGRYVDRDHMGFHSLRVINDDIIAPGGGFPAHPHDNMEIVTYVLEGALSHEDSMGNGSIIRPGEIQRMSAGTGVVHSEFNHSKTDSVRLLQIWFIPDTKNVTPSYAQKSFPEKERRGQLKLVASKDGRDGAVPLHQDVDMLAGLVDGGERIVYPVRLGRAVWVQVARGHVSINGTALEQGDGAAMEDVGELMLSHGQGAEVVVFDLAVA